MYGYGGGAPFLLYALAAAGRFTMSHATHDLLDVPERTADLTESERHRLLEVDRRRYALDALAEYDDPVDLEELAEAVAAREDDLDESEPSVRSAMATALHHIHLPKLADAGVVEYDPRSNVVIP